jgi:glucosamine kinase
VPQAVRERLRAPLADSASGALRLAWREGERQREGIDGA